MVDHTSVTTTLTIDKVLEAITVTVTHNAYVVTVPFIFQFGDTKPGEELVSEVDSNYMKISYLLVASISSYFIASILFPSQVTSFQKSVSWLFKKVIGLFRNKKSSEEKVIEVDETEQASK